MRVSSFEAGLKCFSIFQNMLKEAFEQLWPRWPEGTQGQRLVDASVDSNVNKLADVLWSPSSSYLVCFSSIAFSHLHGA